MCRRHVWDLEGATGRKPTCAKLQVLQRQTRETPIIHCDADLMLQGEEKLTRFKRYNSTIYIWSKVPVRHIIILKACEYIFLKGYDVDNCRDFDRLFSNASPTSPRTFPTNVLMFDEH